MPLAPVMAIKSLIECGKTMTVQNRAGQACSRQKGNAACCDKKLVISKQIGIHSIVHLSYCRALIAVMAFLGCAGCQTGLQRPVPLRTEVLAPEIEIAPASSVEVPIVAAAPVIAPPVIVHQTRAAN